MLRPGIRFSGEQFKFNLTIQNTGHINKEEEPLVAFHTCRSCLPIALFMSVFCVLTLTARQEAGQRIPHFESVILPIFEANCLACHGATLQQNGLDLRTQESVVKGGESGSAVEPGSAEQSLLYEKVRTGSMPLGGKKLKAEEIEAIRLWIETRTLREGQDTGLVKVAKVTDRNVLVPILHVRCAVCHGKRKQEGGFDVRTRESLLKGGKSGPAIIPGKPDESLLIKRIITEEMPPPEMQLAYAVRPVTSSELEELREWIATGAPAEPVQLLKVGRGPDPLVAEEDRQFWSFQPPRRPRVPNVRGNDLVRTPVDAFLLEKLEVKGLSFSPEVNPLVMIRRAYLVLTGLPPDPEEIERYRNDKRSDAYERMVDRLLASPRYGERWARYWLDAAGYADSEGIIDADLIRPNAYRYRDYVIRSLNSDKPYDRFLVEQIAGDELFDYKAARELAPEQRDNLVATGFLRMGPDGTYSSANNSIHERLVVVANQVEIFGSMVMGLTMGCAQCHSHKFDPIPQRDYYRFSAIFRTAFDPYDWYSPNRSEVTSQGEGAYPQRSLSYVPEQEREEVEAHNAPIQEEIKRLKGSLEDSARPYREKLLEEKLGKLPEGVRTDVRKALETSADDRSLVQKYLVEKFEGTLEVKGKHLEDKFEGYKTEASKIKKAISAAQKKLKREPRIRALFDVGGEPTLTYLLQRGDYQNPGGRVEPGVPSVLKAGLKPYKVVKPRWTTETTGRRLALARWLVQPNHPLTARVMVNRVWQHHFGRGLVATPGNFGRTGAKPSHPKLLDWLATEFVRQGWSLKALHKLIMTSTVYRQSTDRDSSRDGADPENKLVGRFPLRRLNADAIRDSILKVAKRLDMKEFGFPEEIEVRPNGEVVAKCSGAGCRRSIYMLQRRSKPLTMLQAFDAPQLNPNCLKRGQSTVSSQALQLWNSEMVRDNARYFAGRVMDAVGEEELEKQVEWVYLMALSRLPSEEEQAKGAADVRKLTRYWREHLEEEVPAEPKQARARWEGLATFCLTILNSAEFIYVH